MPNAYKVWWGCKRKEAFSKTGAEYLAKRRTKAIKEDIRAYKCLYCDFWHIGHHNQKYDPPVLETSQFVLPPPDPDHLIQSIYNRQCDYCWEDIPHSRDEHGYSIALYQISSRK